MSCGRGMDPFSDSNQGIRSRRAAPRMVSSQASLRGGRALPRYRAIDCDVK